ncbi:predicted protein [Naegleria gruberi]|uniref:Predicted protein n=1 Tax=Naegleria gruberi TaxID=5762 RepID=D2W5Z9_NAEGR|nr:uncharacterized protein NAEGRDRAFT_76842 [Naegleria gruberi]EFC35503.1 predicted protein [Naegleria gruberi]|eukprot:XP_002668247.1 predicted protein [Naegleria gruberi strain NEG-M]
MDGNVLGAFNSMPYNERGHKYYGNGEIMLYSFKNSTNIKTYHWTKLNDFFIRSTDSMICYGGDEFGRSALIIDGELLTGSTNICKTFACSDDSNVEQTPLLEKEISSATTPSNSGSSSSTLVKSQSITTFSTEVDFEIYALEVWGFEQIVKKETRSNSIKTNVAASTLLDYSHY